MTDDTMTLAFLEAIKQGDENEAVRLLGIRPELANVQSADGTPATLYALYHQRPALAERIADAKPFVFEPPVTLDLDVAKVEQADWIELIPGFSRTGARSVQFVHDDYTVVFKAFVAAFRLGYQAGLTA